MENNIMDIVQIISSTGALGLSLWILSLFIRGDIVSREGYQAISKQLAVDIIAGVEVRIRENEERIVCEIQTIKNERAERLLQQVKDVIERELLEKRLRNGESKWQGQA